MRVYFFLFLTTLLGVGCVTLRPSTNAPEESALPSGPVSSNSATEAPASPEIRVAILVRQNCVHLEAPESFALSGFPSETPLIQKGEQKYREIALTPDELYSPRAYLQPVGEGQVFVNGHSFKGSLEIIRAPNGQLTVINKLPLEDYVMGVLAGEIPRDWPLEALKAQAIAARTFAVLEWRTAREKNQPYDLESNALFQIYGGSGLVNENIQRAVLETAGRIITYDSKPISAFFHSNCGGETCGAEEVWSQAKPYLRPVDCAFGNNGAHFQWKAEILIPELLRKLRSAGVLLSDLVQLEVLDRDESHRILKLTLMDSDGSRKTMKGSSFRMAVGPDLIRSTRFTAEVLGDKVVFNGRGWGHGVGLCQEGACGMALKGYGAFDILRHYYHGIMVEKLEDETKF